MGKGNMTQEGRSVAPSAELAISNISWPNTVEAHEVAMQVLTDLQINAIDIAPMMVFPRIVGKDAGSIDRDELIAFRRTLRRVSDSGDISEVRVAGFQGVTFGRNESIFSDSQQEQDALTHHMKGIIHLAEFVGARTIVYGCLGTRLFDSQLVNSEVESRATRFFTQLDPIAREANVVIGIEPVSAERARPGTMAFGSSGIEVVDFARRLHTSHGTTQIKFLPDSFGMHHGMQDASDIARDVQRALAHSVLSPHAQIAEPDMAAPTKRSEISSTHAFLDEALHGAFASEAERSVHSGSPRPTVAIEMFSPKDISMPDLAATLRGAIGAARYHYSATLGMAE